MSESRRDDTIIASRLYTQLQLNAREPDSAWLSARPINFWADWQGKNPDPALATEVRALWSPKVLYLRFVCRYQALFVFEDSHPSGRRDQLWERDVAEAFLQPPDAIVQSNRAATGLQTPPREQTPSNRYRAFYKEFEIAPNGMWIDLDISPSGLTDLKSGLQRSVHVNKARKIWTAELAVPIESLTANFDPAQEWRVNFYRVEGKSEPRRYLAWQPTMTAQPDFHVPEKFGKLHFAE